MDLNEKHPTWTEVTGDRLEALRATLYGRRFGILRAVELADGTLRLLPGTPTSERGVS